MSFSLRRPLLLGTCVIALGVSAPAALADYLWLESASGQPAKAYLSEFQPGEHLSLAKLVEPQWVGADGKKQALSANGDAYTVPAAAGDLRVSAKLPEGGKLTIYEAKAGRTETKAGNDLELVPISPNGNTFKLHWKGSVVSASQVNVHTSQEWNRTIKPAADGSVTLDTPFAGRYVLEVAAQVNGAVKVDGKQYDSVVHVATLSFTVER